MAQEKKYEDKYVYMVEQACRDGGFGAKQVATLFNVSKSTIYAWRKEHLEFQVAMDRGRDEFDLLTAETSLKKRLLGYFYNEATSTLVVTGHDKAAPKKMTVSKIVKRHVPPDTHALSFFLRNRNRVRWPDKQDVDVNFTKKLSDAEIDRSIGLIVNNAKKKKKNAARR